MDSRSKLLALFSFLFLFLLLSTSFSLVNAVDEDVVALDLAAAEESLNLAYDAVWDAEEAGAKVSSLLVRLNVGGEYLAEAYVSYRLGSYDNASRFAGFCREVVGDVGGEAIGLRDEARRLREADFVVNTTGSVVGVVVVLILGFLVWGVFRRRYHRRLLGFRVEDVSSES